MKKTNLVILQFILIIFASSTYADDFDWKFNFFCDLSIRDDKIVNDHIKEISVGETLNRLSAGLGFDIFRIVPRGWNFGIGCYFGIPKKAVLELDGIDGTRIETGYLRLFNMDFYLILEKIFLYDYFANFGFYFNGGLRTWIRAYMDNSNKTRDSIISGITEFGMLLNIGDEFGGQLKVGYDILNRDLKIKLGFTEKFNL